MDTIMAPLTPVQLSPVITVRISGPQTLDLLRFFDIRKIDPRISTKTAFRSQINTHVYDEVLLLYFKAPASYTGEDVFEISFHGNPLIVNQALADFAAAGVRMAEPGEFTRRAVLNGKLTLSQAEAVNALIHAPTAAGVASAGHTLYGELDKLFHNIRDNLIAVLAEVEAAIDFYEDLDELDEKSVRLVLQRSVDTLEDLLGKYQTAQRAVKGVQVVLAGAPNAGKSTLFNLLLGSDRAIVADEAGTTRDLITEQLHVGSMSLRLTDTAGIRDTDSTAEREGVRRTRTALEQADLALVLVDLSRDILPETADLLENKNEQTIIIGTKADLEQRAHIKTEINVSSKDIAGIQKLRKLIGERVALLIPHDDFGPAILAETQRLDCESCLAELNAITDDMPVDMQAYHLKNAIAALDRTQGTAVTEQVLDKLFSTFCIGK